MAITPRGYDVDETGKRYTLDLEPILREQGRAFASQKETMQMVADVGRKGIEFAEYLGARQQLGRVKAQLSELDPRDPDFTRLYTEVVMNNPLAFTNANTAPVAKLSTDIALKTAAQAQEQRDMLERISATYGEQAGNQSTRLQGQMELARYKASLPKQFAPRPPRVPSIAERLLFGGDITDTPVVLPNGTTPPASLTPSGDLIMPPGSIAPPGDLMPQGQVDPSAPSVLPPFMEDDQLFETPAVQGEAVPPSADVFDRVIQPDEQLIEGEGDTTSDPKNVVNTPFGRMRLESVTGNSPRLVSTETVTASKPQTAPPKGMEWAVKESNPDGTPAKWGLLKTPERTAAQLSSLEKAVKSRVEVDPRIKDVDNSLSAAEGAFESSKLALAQLKDAPDVQPQHFIPIQNSIRKLAKTIEKLKQQKESLRSFVQDEYMTQLDPDYAEYVQRLRVPAMMTPVIPSAPAPASRPINEQLDDALQSFLKK